MDAVCYLLSVVAYRLSLIVYRLSFIVVVPGFQISHAKGVIVIMSRVFWFLVCKLISKDRSLRVSDTI